MTQNRQEVFSEELISSLLQISLEAGKEILEVYSRDFSVDMKQDDSPLTEADRRSHTVMQRGLENLSLSGKDSLEGEEDKNGSDDGGLPVLSEEGDISEYGSRRTWDRYWLIDPLDGTKEFVKRNGEFTTNIALMAPRDAGHKKQSHRVWEPVIGVVYVPVQDIAYVGWRNRAVGEGSPGSGAPGLAYQIDRLSEGVEGWKSRSVALGSSNEELTLTGPGIESPLRVVASRSHLNEATEEFIAGLESAYNEVELTSFGSSLKLCKVASGEADVYPRFAPTMEWDTAAADGVCRAAGLKVVQADNHMPLEYNKEDLLNPWFLVCRDPRILQH
ncbi:3'(2'),5'-bisphosphate nucleotidase CysQ family protein [Salinispira pacifica]|uniref:3'(2'),5'-bisphosphate nucleotidase CysQ n=1 Tax=Salinispira pacifica TaxID=1307761 RepID=V5WMZ6_9SPIO|nr:3'(2'),5'-bisphosphate nucleotidase CysQ [Salinispira pacifica]AHC16534.1 3'(2'),5'-bisphosphate nucleotidase [Salinispira pacifica]